MSSSGLVGGLVWFWICFRLEVWWFGVFGIPYFW